MKSDYHLDSSIGAPCEIDHLVKYRYHTHSAVRWNKLQAYGILTILCLRMAEAVATPLEIFEV